MVLCAASLGLCCASFEAWLLQVMINIGPTMLAQGDVQGAHTMLTSALTLSRNLRDTPSTVQAEHLAQPLLLSASVADTYERPCRWPAWTSWSSCT